jgi:hypothetical protein
MYYNLTEDQKVFLETSYSMLKEGYTHDEIIQFWSSEDEEQIEFVLESLEYVDIDRKDPELADLMENWAIRTGQAIWNAGPRAYRAVRTAQKLRTLRRLAQVTNPSIKDRRTILRLQKELGDQAKGIKIRYKQTPADELAAVQKRTTGADDVLRTNRPGPEGSATVQGSSARTWERTGPVVQQAQPTPAPAPVKPVKPVKPFKQQVKDLGQNLGRTAQVTTAVGGGVALTTLLQPDSDKTPKTKEPSATQKEVDKDKKMYGDTVPLGSFNISPQGTDRRNEVEDQIKRDNAARAQEPSPPKETTTDQPTTTTTQQTNTTPPVVKPKRKRINFGSGSTPGVSRRGVTNSYEYVIGKLIAEGHASSVEEAEYVYKQLDEDYIESMLLEQNLSYSDATAILKNHQYDKAQLMKMSRKATETGQHGLAQACYDAACKMKI